MTTDPQGVTSAPARDAAIEAAAQAAYAYHYGDGMWQYLAEGLRDVWRTSAGVYLTAALPHLRRAFAAEAEAAIQARWITHPDPLLNLVRVNGINDGLADAEQLRLFAGLTTALAGSGEPDNGAGA